MAKFTEKFVREGIAGTCAIRPWSDFVVEGDKEATFNNVAMHLVSAGYAIDTANVFEAKFPGKIADILNGYLGDWEKLRRKLEKFDPKKYAVLADMYDTVAPIEGLDISDDDDDDEEEEEKPAPKSKKSDKKKKADVVEDDEDEDLDDDELDEVLDEEFEDEVLDDEEIEDDIDDDDEELEDEDEEEEEEKPAPKPASRRKKK